MLRRSLIWPHHRLQSRIHHPVLSSKASSEPKNLVQEPDEQEQQRARTWLAGFTVQDIPKKLCEIHFTRASGPGGQNVNKYEWRELDYELN